MTFTASADTPTPTSIVLHRRSRCLEVAYSDGVTYRLPFELMRVYSPSAEIQGHGPGQAVLQLDKQQVDIVALDPIGHYAVLPHFSDGHATGIYSWDYLRFLGREEAALWAQYRERVASAGQRAASGAADALDHTHPPGQGCSHHRTAS